jgi:hypothetical protein
MVAMVGDLIGAVLIVQTSPGLLKTEVQTGLQAPFICISRNKRNTQLPSAALRENRNASLIDTLPRRRERFQVVAGCAKTIPPNAREQ